MTSAEQATTAPKAKQVVWVIGAGFSKGLGGPLLVDLFTKNSESDLALRYPKKDYELLHSGAAGLVRKLYLNGFANPESIRWSNAEEFIEFLDLANEELGDGVRNFQALHLWKGLGGKGPAAETLKQLLEAARRVIAAECSAFLEATDTNREQWQPYRRWAESLGVNDTIISFNYDRVVERLIGAQDLIARKHLGAPFSKIRVVTPTSPETGEPVDKKFFNGWCPLLKLHGSVDWKSDKATGTVLQDKDERFGLSCPDDELSIATPGPSKKRNADAKFKVLWDIARERLRSADAIVFVGFRFPETDAYARQVVLDAIRENSLNFRAELGEENHNLSFHVVLGPLGHDSERLKALLGFVCENRNDLMGRPRMGIIRRTFKVQTFPLRAQDFLGVVNRDNLF